MKTSKYSGVNSKLKPWGKQRSDLYSSKLIMNKHPNLNITFICYRTNVGHEVLSGDQICRWILNSDSQNRISLLLELSYYVIKIFRHSILVVLDFDELVVGLKSLIARTVTTKRHRAICRSSYYDLLLSIVAMYQQMNANVYVAFYGNRNYCILLHSL